MSLLEQALEAAAKKLEILAPCVADDKLHPNFKILAESDSYSPARGIIKELSFAFTDLDGNYRKDFQTTGFDGRLWELYLIRHADIAPSHVDRDADMVEHVLGADLVEQLERELTETETFPASPHTIAASGGSSQ